MKTQKKLENRDFSDLSEDEVEEMWNRCCDAAIKYSDEIGMGGLSLAGRYSIYRALHDALESEWKIAKGETILLKSGSTIETRPIGKQPHEGVSGVMDIFDDEETE